jgi:hypothetical protein
MTKSLRNTLILINILTWFFALLIGEVRHRVRTNVGVPLKTRLEVKESMSREQFDAHLKQGRKLVIIDDLVVDV